MVCTICRNRKKCDRYVMKGHKVGTGEPAERFVYLCRACKSGTKDSIDFSLKDRLGIEPETMEEA